MNCEFSATFSRGGILAAVTGTKSPGGDDVIQTGTYIEGWGGGKGGKNYVRKNR